MSLATLNEATAPRLRLYLPAWGCWWADLDLAEPIEQSGAAALVLAGTACTGRVVSGGVVNGRAAYHVVGGRGCLGKSLPEKSYNDDGGVRLRTLLADLAAETGETIADVPTTELGPHYARAAGPAYETLNALAPRNWYMGLDGVIRIGQRSATTYAGDAPRVDPSPAGRYVTLAVDSIDGLVPGVQIDGHEPATDIEFTLDPKRLTAKVYYAASPLTRRLKALADVVAGLDPFARYRAAYEYRVVTQSGDRLNLQPVRTATGMPDLANVPVRLAPGVKAAHLLGSLVMVAFADADPSRPFVFAGDAAGAPGWSPISLDIGGPGAVPIAYQGSPVQAGPFSGTVVLGSTLGNIRP